MLEHFLATGLKFSLAAAGFLEGGALALQLFLGALELGELLLCLGDL
jgi:hypothetical protein